MILFQPFKVVDRPRDETMIHFSGSRWVEFITASLPDRAHVWLAREQGMELVMSVLTRVQTTWCCLQAGYVVCNEVRTVSGFGITHPSSPPSVILCLIPKRSNLVETIPTTTMQASICTLQFCHQQCEWSTIRSTYARTCSWMGAVWELDATTPRFIAEGSPPRPARLTPHCPRVPLPGHALSSHYWPICSCLSNPVSHGARPGSFLHVRPKNRYEPQMPRLLAC